MMMIVKADGTKFQGKTQETPDGYQREDSLSRLANCYNHSHTYHTYI